MPLTLLTNRTIMKILFIHADYVEYKTREKTPVAEEISEDKKKGNLKNPLIAFVSIEGRDEDSADEKKLTDEAFKEIL